MHNRPILIKDPKLGDALARLEQFTKMLQRRIEEFQAAESRVERTLAVLEAEVAASLVTSAGQEVSLRHLSHGLPHDPTTDIAERVQPYHRARADLEAEFGPILRA